MISMAARRAAPLLQLRWRRRFVQIFVESHEYPAYVLRLAKAGDGISDGVGMLQAKQRG